MTTAIAITILGILILGALLRGISALLWSKSDEGQTWSRGHNLGYW